MKYRIQLAASFVLAAIAYNSVFPATAQQRVTIHAWEQKYRNQLTHETGGIFSKDGILLKEMQGNEKEIPSTPGDRRLSRNKILRHNHPTDFNASFSVADWEYAAEVEAIETGVVTQWSRFRLSCDWDAQWWQGAGKPTLSRIQSELWQEYLDLAIAIQQQGYTKEQTDLIVAGEYWHAVNTRAAKELGCQYSKEDF